MSDNLKKDMEIAAKLGKQVDAETQKQYFERIKEETRIRAEEIKREKALQEEAMKKSPEPEVLMSKRERRLAAMNQLKQEQQQAEEINKPVEAPKIENNNPILEESIQNEPDENITTELEEKEPVMTEEVKEEVKQPAIKLTRPSNMFKPFAPKQTKTRIEELPSYFLSYPKNAEVWVVPYSGDDIDELSNSKVSLKYILTKCLEGVYTNFDKNQLTFYDLLYLSYYRRRLSIAENVVAVTSQCPYCEKYSTKEVDVNTEIEFEDARIPSLPINIDFSFGTLSFTYLTYENYMKMQTNLDSEELAYCCINDVELENKDDDKYQTLQQFFGKLTGEDLALLKEVKRLTYHGTKPIHTLCQNKDCGRTYETQVNEWDAIISPFRTSRQDIRSKISFG